HFQALGPRTLAEDFFHPFFSRRWLCEIEDVALHRLHLAQHEAGTGNRHTNVEREPRLADLRLAGEDGDALWAQLGQDDAHRLELLRLQLARGDDAIFPRLPVGTVGSAFLGPDFGGRLRNDLFDLLTGQYYAYSKWQSAPSPRSVSTLSRCEVGSSAAVHR